MSDLLDLRDRFDVGPGWLDAASMGVPPRTVSAAMRDAVDAWARGEPTPRTYEAPVARARELFAGLVGVPASQVAVGNQAAVAVAMVAASQPAGSEVLVAEGEFTSVTFPFEVAPGVAVRRVALAGLADAVRPSTTLVAVSSVQSSDGALADLTAIREAADRHGARVLVDATQAAGWLPFDADSVDYSVTSAYKWLLNPRGTTFLTVRPDAMAALRPVDASWFAGEDVWSSIYTDTMVLAADARRYDISPAWLSWVGAVPALELITEVGVEAIHAHDVALADGLRERLGMAPAGSAIVSVPLAGGVERLAHAGIRCAARAGAARLAFHLWNTSEDVELAASVLRDGDPSPKTATV